MLKRLFDLNSRSYCPFFCPSAGAVRENQSPFTKRSAYLYDGVQSRSFTLAHDIDDEQTQAKYQDGVLELILREKAASFGKKITIN
jgi:HSP20 family molecular chaperone IbpA